MEFAKSNLPIYQLFENRRKFPRMKMGIPASLKGAGKEKLDVTLHDLSPEAAQIRIPIEKGSDLFSSKKGDIQELQSLNFTLDFELNYQDTTTSVTLDARPVHLRIVDKRH